MSNTASWNAFEFEKHIQALFKQSGFEVSSNRKDNEPGYDFIVHNQEDDFVVQVKNHKRKVPISTTNKFRDFLDSSAIKKGILVSSQGFSPQALATVSVEKPQNFYLGHYDNDSVKIVWDYPQTGINVERSSTTNQTLYLGVFTANGGVGKTTVSAHLAGAFALSGYHVALLDSDPENNLSNVTSDEVNVPNPRGKNKRSIRVYHTKDWSQLKQASLNVCLIDCSPAMERNLPHIMQSIEHFIVPVTLNPLGAGTNAEVVLRSIQQIRNINTTATIFILVNNHSSKPDRVSNQILANIQKELAQLADQNVTFIKPNELAIRSSRLLEKWGEQPQLAFELVAGRCHPRDDFLQLSEFLLEHIDINK